MALLLRYFTAIFSDDIVALLYGNFVTLFVGHPVAVFFSQRVRGLGRMGDLLVSAVAGVLAHTPGQKGIYKFYVQSVQDLRDKKDHMYMKGKLIFAL